MVGEVLNAGDADYDMLTEQPVDSQRNPVTYSTRYFRRWLRRIRLG